MLKLVIEGEEWFDDETEQFSSTESFELLLEHSLLSLSKWESKYQVPFLSKESKSPEQIRYYVECMIISPNPPENAVDRLSQANMNDLNLYIESTQSATTFGDMPETKGRGETITSELVYYWMVAFNIPFECESWHLNRLFSLIRICNVKSQKPKKRSPGQIAAERRAINAKRRAELGTRG